MRVTLVDLDLEAPGIAPIVDPDAVEYGMADLLVESLAAGRPVADVTHYARACDDPSLVGTDGAPIWYIPAGRMGGPYLEKLARLDYELMVTDRKPLGGLLKRARRGLRPDFVLLDCRAGLHDLAGLAVHCLAHLSVIFGQDSESSWQGLSLVVRSLGMLRPNPGACQIVHALEPGEAGEVRDTARRRFLERSHRCFEEHYYTEGAVRYIDDSESAHYPIQIPYLSGLARYQRVTDVAEELTHPAFRELTEKVLVLSGKPRR